MGPPAGRVRPHRRDSAGGGLRGRRAPARTRPRGSLRGWRNMVGNLIEFFWNRKTYHRPHFTGMSVKSRGVRFHRIRDFKRYYFQQYSANISLLVVLPFLSQLLFLRPATYEATLGHRRGHCRRSASKLASAGRRRRCPRKLVVRSTEARPSPWLWARRSSLGPAAVEGNFASCGRKRTKSWLVKFPTLWSQPSPGPRLSPMSRCCGGKRPTRKERTG